LQVDDHFLSLLAECKCQLEVLVIDGCSSVTGKQIFFLFVCLV
jgi:hypothetical protein